MIRPRELTCIWHTYMTQNRYDHHNQQTNGNKTKKRRLIAFNIAHLNFLRKNLPSPPNTHSFSARPLDYENFQSNLTSIMISALRKCARPKKKKKRKHSLLFDMTSNTSDLRSKLPPFPFYSFFSFLFIFIFRFGIQIKITYANNILPSFDRVPRFMQITCPVRDLKTGCGCG